MVLVLVQKSQIGPRILIDLNFVLILSQFRPHFCKCVLN